MWISMRAILMVKSSAALLLEHFPESIVSAHTCIVLCYSSFSLCISLSPIANSPTLLAFASQAFNFS